MLNFRYLIRDGSENSKGRVNQQEREIKMRRIEMPSRKVLENLYSNLEKSLSDIAVEFNVSAMTVLSWMKKYNIETRISTQSVYHELRETLLSKNQIDLIIGSVLGDGCLRIPKRGKNAMFSEKHSEKQRQYLAWKRDLLKPFVPSDLYKEYSKSHVISGKECVVDNSYSLRSISHPILTDIYKLFYKNNGNKIIPVNLENYLNLFVLAVWFMDDGSLVWKHRYYRFDLHTECFSYNNQVTICRALSKYFFGRVLIIPRQYDSGEKYYISLRDKFSVYTILSKLVEYAPQCMKYKFDVSI